MPYSTTYDTESYYSNAGTIGVASAGDGSDLPAAATTIVADDSRIEHGGVGNSARTGGIINHD